MDIITTFILFLKDQEDWLIDRILFYAEKNRFVQYTSTLREAWRLSIAGLTESCTAFLLEKGDHEELSPDRDYRKDPAARFGIEEAILHRQRGINFQMFLSLMKYYSQTYQDLIQESKYSKTEKQKLTKYISRFFDIVEIAFCSTWFSQNSSDMLEELQDQNRKITNEKNRYLTIFESLSIPVFIVSTEGFIENMNLAASGMFKEKPVPGSTYYSSIDEPVSLPQVFPWLSSSYKNFLKGKTEKSSFQDTCAFKDRYYHVSFSESLDVSGKTSGTVVIIEDITQRKIMEAELNELAATDPLTGLKNRRFFLFYFKNELLRNERYGHHTALLLLDIDFFKIINDTHGHLTGDRVLMVMAGESKQLLRESDLLCRWGGEEFLFLLPETTMEESISVAERLRERLASLKIENDDGVIFGFTVSIGLTLTCEKCSEAQRVISKADEAMYLAKEQGRNRVVFLPCVSSDLNE